MNTSFEKLFFIILPHTSRVERRGLFIANNISVSGHVKGRGLFIANKMSASGHCKGRGFIMVLSRAKYRNTGHFSEIR